MVKTNAEKCQNYRDRKKKGNLSIKKVFVNKRNNAKNCRMYRLRKKMLEQRYQSSVNDVLCTPTSSNSQMTFGSSLPPVTTDLPLPIVINGRRNYISTQAEINSPITTGPSPQPFTTADFSHRMPASTSDVRNAYTSKWNFLFDKSVKEWISFKPKPGLEVYPCYACRHIFGSKNSFIDHVNRRSIRIRYCCHHCVENSSAELTFYNPCSFHLHARLHFSANSGTINLDDVEVSLLLVGLAGFIPHPNIKVIYDLEDKEPPTGVINNRFYSPTAECYGQKIVHFTPNEVFLFTTVANNQQVNTLALKQISSTIPRCILVSLDCFNMNRSPLLPPVCTDKNNETTDNEEIVVKSEPTDENQNQSSFEYTMPIITKVESLVDSDNSNSSSSVEYQSDKCPECKQFPLESIEKHFLQENRPNNECFRCDTCNFIAPSECSFKAHSRIHLNQSPFVCPECGKCFRSWNPLQNHMNTVCFHLAKQVRVKCPGKKCGKIFAQHATFSAHFSQVHLQATYVCDNCDARFTNDTEYFEHSEKEHSSHEVFHFDYTCNVCADGESFHSLNKDEHIGIHGKNCENFVYVHICKFCRSFFKSTATYTIHQQRCSKIVAMVDKKNKDQYCSAPSETTEKVGNNESSKERLLVNINEPKMDSVMTICTWCKIRLRFKVSNFKNLVAICPKCGGSIYLPARKISTNTLKPIVKKQDELKLFVDPADYTCLLCSDKISEPNDHLKICRFSKPQVLLPKVTGEQESEAEDENSSPKSNRAGKRKTKRYDYTRLENKHRKLLALEAKYPELHTNDPAQPKPFDGIYRCSICPYSNEERAVFSEHVTGHRLISTSYQCMECGECFVVKPSLAKHLQYYHQIFDIDLYLQDNDCYDKEAVKELEETINMSPNEFRGPLKDNQCRVCLQEFETEPELNKHLRNHGMAFLSHVK